MMNRLPRVVQRLGLPGVLGLLAMAMAVYLQHDMSRLQSDLDSGRLVAPWGFVDTGGEWALCSARGNPDLRIAALADWLRAELA